MSPPIILFDYPFSPFSQKLRTYFAASGIPYSRCEQPMVLPRPTLADMGITYRRIPVLAIGKDIFCDSSEMLSVLQDSFKEKALKTSPTDAAFEAFGSNVFWSVLGIIDANLLSPEFVKDRVTIFPAVARKDFATLRPSALGEFRANLSIVEKDFLGGGVLGTGKISLADVHVGWIVRWVLRDLQAGNEKGFGKEDFPKVYKWIESLPPDSEKMISERDAQKTILDAQPSWKSPEIQVGCPLGLEKGMDVTVESTDSEPGSHPQKGKFIGSDVNEVSIELPNKLRLHFPKKGYIIRKDNKAAKKVWAPILSDGHSP